MFLWSLWFTRAAVNSVNIAPTTQSAISGSLVTFTITWNNGTGDAYLKYVLPTTVAYDIKYQNSSSTPVNNSLLSLGTEHDPVFFISANSNFSVTITAKVITTARTFPTIHTVANFGPDMQISTILTSAIAQITPISDLAVTNVLTGTNPSLSGDNVYYYITLQNIWSTSATGITFVSTFPIPTLFTPTATFNGIPHTYNYINYPQNFVWSGNYLSNINPWQIVTIILNAPMMQNFPVGTTFNQIATTTTATPEYTTGNNSATATGIVQAVADVRVTKTLTPFTGYNSGNIVTYTITYGNSWGKPATGVTLYDTISTWISIPVNSWYIGTLPAGSGWTLTLTWTLLNVFMSWQVFVNTVSIYTPSIEANTGNNSATATWVIQWVANVSVDIIANNLTRPQLDTTPYGSGPNILIQAVSGDIVQLTITYVNFGNTIASNATIGISWTQGFVSLGAYNNNIGTLPLNTTWVLIVTWIVGPKNYISFTPTARLVYNSSQLRTDSVIIQEPLVCGDGLLTRTEVCDTQGNLGVLYSGQVCENQQGMCVLRTQSIINNACINYQYTDAFGVVISGQACDDAIVTLTPPSCSTMTGSAPVNSSNGFNVNLTCKWNNSNSNTPISIDCGNGTTIAWTGANFNGICNYTTSFIGNAQCRVGNDVSNAACRVPISVNAGLCEDLDARDGNIALINEDGDAQSTFSCTTVNGVRAQTMDIDCGNGTHHPANNVSIFEASCEYTGKQTYTVQCTVDGVSSPACKESLIVDEPILWYCGNNIREGYEQCDGTDTPEWKTCTKYCNIEWSATMVGCFNVGNTNISIQKWEILPFRWTLDDESFVNSCDGNKNGVIKNSLTCEFNIYNGENKESDNQKHINAEGAYTLPCKVDTWLNKPIFDWFLSKDGYRSLDHAFGKYYITGNEFTDLVDDIFWEYKISLDSVKYDYCDNGIKKEWIEIDRVCSVDFAVTQPYLLQKSSFGLTPKASSINLDGYEMIDGTDLISSTDLEDIMVLDESEYAGGSEVQTMMDSFITKYSKLAVKYTTVKSDEGNDITVSKVPGQDIVVFKGNGTLTYTEWSAKIQPFTIIVDGPSIKINWSIENTNSMFLVNKGNITFLSSADVCTKTQVVKWIFVTNKWSFLAGPDLANDSTNKKWCEFGWLKVQGILIGDGIEDLVQSRRSQLNHRFMLGSSSDASIKAERRNEIFNGASVLIEYSPSLWSALPPGASEFTKALEIYKK